MVYYQHQDKKAWLGPVKVFAVKGNEVFIFANGSVRKVPRCNVQLCKTEVTESESEESKEENVEEQKGVSVRFEEQSFGENINEDDLEKKERRVMRSMTDVERRELERNKVSTFWMKVENTECFDDVTIYTVEVPVKEHKRPEVVEAKEKEIENLEKYGVFEKSDDEGKKQLVQDG